jgi:hypothetical protein
MAYCTKCGSEVDDGDAFCHACGAAVFAAGGAGAHAAPVAAGAEPSPGYPTPPVSAPAPPLASAYPGQAQPESPQEIAERRVRQKLELWWHLGSYVIVNLFLVIVWAITGRGYPWFVWVMIGWGIGVAFHLMQYFMTVREEPRRERMIQREMERLQRKQAPPAAEPGAAGEGEKE